MKFILNGTEVTYTGALNASLLDVLRDEYRLTGVKCGCKEGECGACSVIMDDRLVNSCMVAMGQAADSTIISIEGYRDTERYAVLDRAYASVGAAQCGFCIPGMILASECILAKTPHPSEDQIREGISGNLCRCTGYTAIVTAVGIAAKEGEGLW